MLAVQDDCLVTLVGEDVCLLRLEELVGVVGVEGGESSGRTANDTSTHSFSK